MLFNSFLFLFVFLPIVLLGFYGLGSKVKLPVIIRWLFLCSLFFYGWWKPMYLILIGLSIIFNFFISKEVAKGKNRFWWSE